MRTRVALFLSLCFAAAAPAQDPSGRGSFLTRKVDLDVAHPDGSTSRLRVILPAAADRARPTILVIHGLYMSPAAYEGLAEHLASRGYAAALFDQYARGSTNLSGWVAAGRFAITALERADADPRSGVFGELDLARLGVIGHSYGGMTTIGLAATDPRVKAAVALAPGAALRPQLLQYAATIRSTPLLVVTGRWDWLAVPGTFGRPAYDAVQHRDKLYVQLSGVAHMGFVGDGPAAARRYANPWFDRWLQGAADDQGWTDGRRARQDGDLSDWDAPGPLPSAGTVTSDTLNVRTGPGTGHAVVTTLPRGARVEIQDQRQGWYRVTWAGAPAGELWVGGSHVRTVTTVTVVTDSLNVRSGPGTSHAVVTALQRGTQVDVLDQREGWYRVTWAGAPAGELWLSAGYTSGR